MTVVAGAGLEASAVRHQRPGAGVIAGPVRLVSRISVIGDGGISWIKVSVISASGISGQRHQRQRGISGISVSVISIGGINVRDISTALTSLVSASAACLEQCRKRH